MSKSEQAVGRPQSPVPELNRNPIVDLAEARARLRPESDDQKFVTEREVLDHPPLKPGSPPLLLYFKPGFGARINAPTTRSPRGKRSYFVQVKVNGKSEKDTFAEVGEIGFKKALKYATDARANAQLNGKSITKRAKRAAEAAAYAAANPQMLTVAAAYQLMKADKTSPEQDQPWSDVTLAKYEKMVERFTPWGWMERDLFSFTDNLEAFAQQFIKLRDQVGLCEADQSFRCFRALFNYHVLARAKGGMKPVNPCEMLNKKGGRNLWYKGKQGEQRMIKTPDFPAWWKSVEGMAVHVGNDSAWALYFHMQAALNFRRKELLHFEWTMWDKRIRWLTIPKGINKSRRAYVIPVGPRLAKLIEAHRKTQVPGTKFFFASRAGTRLKDPGNVLARHKEKHLKAKKPGLVFSCHDLRHMWLTLAHKLRIPTKTYKMLMNHSTKGDVSLRYIHPEDQELMDAQVEMETEIFKRAGLI